uniref:Tnf receptor associated factor n=1 Tax=Rhipicephalus appendiculatus TaxID=34631 RepID=A0A131YM58_RHIAP
MDRPAATAPAVSSVPALQKRYVIGFEQAGLADWTEMEFASPIPRFTSCLVCGAIASEMLWSRCWHVFCPLCAAMMGSEEGVVACPLDGAVTPLDALHRDKIALEVLLAFRVYCPNRSLGCDYIGPMDKLRDHTRLCGFYNIQCQICGIWLKRFQLRDHTARGCTAAARSEQNPAPVHRQVHTVVTGDLYPDIARTLNVGDAAQATPPPAPSAPSPAPSRLSVIFNGNSKEYDVLGMITAMKDMCREYEDFKNAFNDVRESVTLHAEQARADIEDLESRLREQHRLWREDVVGDVRHLRSALGTRTFDWQVAPFSKLRKTALKKNTLLKSEDFYVGHHGYRVALSGAFNKNPADGRVYLSVYVHLLRGMFDSALKWPYRTVTTVKLVNQEASAPDKEVTFDPGNACEDEQDCFRRPRAERNVGYGFPLAALEEIENPANGFLKDDAFVVQFLANLV